ncbi:helix-turn-helix transcriptional regulator [Kitasatospora sp. NPDC059648]|uniref:helix-turn-helix transcriptional regulator n=1 Tax=Kitasatospora sp. NPDC059648 TaxID=3346894 RepID=UPI0036A4FD7C
MIPAGREYVTTEQAAKILGVAFSTFQSRRQWEKFPASVKSFARVDPDAKRPLRLWDKEQVQAWAKQRELPLDKQDIPVLPLDPQNNPADQRDGDLLDWIEAWESLPENDRPHKDAWPDYVKKPAPGKKVRTIGPESKTEINGVRYWERGTVRRWNENRPKGHGAARTGGRKAGSPNQVASIRKDAVERVARTAELLAAAPADTAAAVIAQKLVEEFGFTKRTGERLVADTQKGLALRNKVAVVQQELWDEPRERIVKVLADDLDLPPAVAAHVLDDVLAQRAKGQPRAKRK